MGVTGKRNRCLLAFALCLGIFMGAGQITRADDLASQLKKPAADKTQIVTLKGGSSLVGRITAVDADTITFAVDAGELKVAIDRIEDIREIPTASIKEGTYWFENPNLVRLYFSPTGRTLKGGQGYFSDIYLFFPSVSVGLTDNISVGGGFSLFPGIDFDQQLFYFIPKIGTKVSPHVSLAGSALIIRIPKDVLDDDHHDAFYVDLLFGMCTVGSDDKSLTFGLGYGYSDGGWAEKPAVLLGTDLRFARRAAFVSENWIFPGADAPLISYGIRFFGENLSVDLALFNVMNENILWPGVPYLDFVFNF